MTSDGFSTPSHFKAPAPPHPTPYSTSSFLTRSKLPSSSVVYGDKKLKAPMHNPYDRFPQNEFDAWIGNLKGSIRRALGQEEEPSPQLHLASSSAETPETHSVSPSAEEQSDWDGVEDSFAEIKARRHISNGKGKERALSVDSEDESDISGSSDIELLLNEDEGQIAHEDEDEADELEVGREVSVEHWDEEAPEEALQDTVTHGQDDEVLESDEEVYGSEEEEEDDDDGNAPPFAGPVDVVVVDSDSDSDRQRSSPVGPSYHYQEEDEEDEEIEEGSEEEGFSDGEAQLPLSSMRQPERSEYVEDDEADDDDESIEVIAVDDDSDIQPEEDEGDEVLPPRATRHISDQAPQLLDPWAGPQTYAEDFYSGGDFLRVPDGATPRSAAHLLGEDGDDVAFLTPGVVTPHEAQSTPIGHGLDLEQDGDDMDTQYIDSEMALAVQGHEPTQLSAESAEPDPSGAPPDFHEADVPSSLAPIQIADVPQDVRSTQFDMLPTPPEDIQHDVIFGPDQILETLSAFVANAGINIPDIPYSDILLESSERDNIETGVISAPATLDITADISVDLASGSEGVSAENHFIVEAELVRDVTDLTSESEQPHEASHIPTAAEEEEEVIAGFPISEVPVDQDITSGEAKLPQEDLTTTEFQRQVNTPPLSPEPIVEETSIQPITCPGSDFVGQVDSSNTPLSSPTPAPDTATTTQPTVELHDVDMSDPDDSVDTRHLSIDLPTDLVAQPTDCSPVVVLQDSDVYTTEVSQGLDASTTPENSALPSQASEETHQEVSPKAIDDVREVQPVDLASELQDQSMEDLDASAALAIDHATSAISPIPQSSLELPVTSAPSLIHSGDPFIQDTEEQDLSIDISPRELRTADEPQAISLSQNGPADASSLDDTVAPPAVELPPGSDRDETDLSVSSNAIDSNNIEIVDDTANNILLPRVNSADNVDLEVPVDNEVTDVVQSTPTLTPTKANVFTQGVAHDNDADGEEDPEFSSASPDIPDLLEVETQLSAVDEDDPPTLHESEPLEVSPEPDRNEDAESTMSCTPLKPTAEKRHDLVPEFASVVSPKPSPTSPREKKIPSPPASLDDATNSLKRKRLVSNSNTSPTSVKQRQPSPPTPISYINGRDKGKGKARDLDDVRVQLGNRPLSRSSSVASGGSDTFSQPSPTLARQTKPSIEPIVSIPPPLFLAHSHSKIPKPLHPYFPNDHANGSGLSQLPGRTLPPKAGSPSKPQRTLSFSMSSPRTRSNCRFHRISLPREEGGPRVSFLVPGCSLLDRELMEEEEIQDHGDATVEDSKHMTPVNELDFNLDLVGTLRQLVGVDLLREQEVYYLPPIEERTRTLPQKTALSKIVARENDTPGSSHIRRPSLDSAVSARPPASVTHSSISSSTSSATRKPLGSDIGSVSISSSIGRLTDAEDENPKRHKSIVDTDAPNSILDTEITVPAKRRPLKAARRNKRMDATYTPQDEEESDGSDEEKPQKGRRKSRPSNRGVKRTRTSGVDDESNPDKAGKKLKMSMSQP